MGKALILAFVFVVLLVCGLIFLLSKMSKLWDYIEELKKTIRGLRKELKVSKQFKSSTRIMSNGTKFKF